MKKTTLTLALATALFTIMTLLNCSKKDEPAPATTTTSGTTNSGTTTSGTTTSGTTTSGTTTSGTTTSGTTTSGSTTSGTTTAGAPNIRETGISGSLTVNGVSQKIIGKATISESGANNMTLIIFDSENYKFGVAIGTETLRSGTYSVDNYSSVVSAAAPNSAGITVMSMKPYTGAQFWSFKESAGSIKVVVSNKNISVDTVNLTQYNDANNSLSASCNITLQ